MGPYNGITLDSKNAIYIANSDSDSISIIDKIFSKVVGKFSFDINPPLSGNIKCGDIIAPLERSFYLDSGITCESTLNKGFEFLS